jgi:starvation-inducible DNA-binding protein
MKQTIQVWMAQAGQELAGPDKTVRSHPMSDTLEKPSTQHAARPPFRASRKLADHLQQLHVDLIDLHLQGKQAHWNVVGKNFRDLHLQLDEVVDAAREFSDTVAERMRAVYITPDGRAATVAGQTSLPPFPADEIDTGETIDLITAAVYATAGTARRIHDDVDAEDPTTADILHTILERLEQLAWMIDSENRIANRSIPRPIQE